MISGSVFDVIRMKSAFGDECEGRHPPGHIFRFMNTSDSMENITNQAVIAAAGVLDAIQPEFVAELCIRWIRLE